MIVQLTRRQTCTVEIPDDTDDVAAAAIAASDTAPWDEVHDEPVITAVDPIDYPHDPFCLCDDCETARVSDEESWRDHGSLTAAERNPSLVGRCW